MSNQPPSLTATPLLSAENLRVDVRGAVAASGVTFASHAKSIAIVGDEYGLFAALEGAGEVRAGSLRLAGHEVSGREHLRSGDVGLAPFDPPLPARWTAREYLTWSARLAGYGHARARDAAESTFAELELGSLAGLRIEGLTSAQKRALVLAAACVTSPSILIASSPLSSLSGGDVAYVSATLERAARDRRWIVSVTNLHAGSPEHALAAIADDVLLFASGNLVRRGKLRQLEDGTVGYTLTLRDKTAQFGAALRARGITLLGGPQRFFVELPPSTKTHDLLALSVELGAPIVELVPRISLSETTVDREVIERREV